MTRSAAPVPLAAPSDRAAALKPILIGGLGRSGTTLMARLLGSHSQIAVPPTELGFFGRAFGVDFDPTRPISDRGELVDRLRQLYRFALRDWGLDESELFERAGDVEPSYRGLFAFVLDEYRRRSGKPRVGEKTPKYERWLDILDGWFGTFPYVQMVRNPFDAFASVKGYAGERRANVLVWAHDWNVSAAAALRGASREPHRYCVVRYEDLVADPPSVLGRICSLIGVEPEIDRMVGMEEYEATENSSFERAAARREYVGRLRHADDIDRRRVVTPAEREAIAALCGSLAYLLGYELAPVRLRRGSFGRLPYGRVPARAAIGPAVELARERVRRASRRS